MKTKILLTLFLVVATNLLSFSQVFEKHGAGVTILIHGWNPDGNQPVWMDSMATAIITRAGGVGQIGTITVTGTKGNLTATCSNWNFDLATATSGEIVVLVNWTAVSNHLTTGVTAQAVAAAVAPLIYQSQNSQPALSELPIHLIGHSRGGGMVFEIARLLGLQGIEVEHVTALDPHPLTTSDPQGLAAPFGPGQTIDTPISLYENILFVDNYYQNINYPEGQYLTGAYNRLWNSLPGGYNNESGYTYNILGTNYNFSDHLNIILMYYGTINLSTPASNGEATMNTTERGWFNTFENAGQNTGFVYSRIIAGNRKSTSIPVVNGDEIIAGYNNNVILGGAGARISQTWTNAVWPNVITSVASKNSVELSSGTQTINNNDALQINYTYRSYTNASVVTFYLDVDRNPYNNNNTATIGTKNLSATGSAITQSNLAWAVTGLTSGTKYYVYSKISDGTHTRYQYLNYEFILPCIVNIPDTNFKAALLAIPGLDANSDGEIECSEASAYTGKLIVSSNNISDLTGIAAFTNITYLNCSNNLLTTLDVSSNKGLDTLYCTDNSLTGLNVSANTNLRYLNCSGNSLPTLDVSSNTNLTYLNCSTNSLTSLDVSSNTNLTYLDCSSNSLTSLNVSSTTTLKTLNCYLNTLTSLDVSSNKALTYLDCIDNLLKSLNVSGLTFLSTIYCNSNQLMTLNVSSNIALTQLNCGYDSLTTLDVSSNTALENFQCNNNSLTSLNVKNGNNTKITNFVANNNPGLTCIQVDNATWSTTNWKNIDAGASFNTDCSCVNPTSGGTINADQSGCNPFKPVAFISTIDPSGQTGTLEYKWQLSTTSSSTGFSDISSSNAATFNPGLLSNTTWYQRLARVECQSDWTGATESNVVKITVNPLPTVTATGGAICSGSSITISAAGATTYAWSNNSTSASQVVSPVSTTGYTVTGTNGNGCKNTTNTTVTVNPLPTVTATGGTICFGSSITISAAGASTYAWSNNSTSDTQVVSPVSTTVYTVTGTNGNGCKNTANTTVTVNPLPTVTATGGTICSGSSITISAAGATSYAWSNNNSNASQVVSPTATTIYKVIGTDGYGCKNTANTTVNVNPLPTANAGNAVTICEGTSTVLTATGGSSYVWSNGIPTALNTVTPTNTTTYTVTVTSNLCSATSRVEIIVNSVSASAGNNVGICTGGSVVLTATGGSSYAWSNEINTATNSVAPTKTTIYTVTVTSNNCSATSNVVVSVAAQLMANAGNDVTICQGNSTILTASGGTAYSWSNDVNAVTDNVNPNTTTTYTVTAFSGNNCSATANVVVNVNPFPTANAGNNVTVCQGTSTILTATGGVVYAWSNGMNSATNNVTPNATTTYTVTVTSNNCAATANVVVNVNPLPTANAGNNVTVCQGTSTILTATGGTAYSWSNGVNTVTNNVNPNTTTTYTVTVTSNNCAATANVVVNVNNIPASPVITQSGDSLISNALTNNQWYNSTGSIQGAINPVYVATASDSYYDIVTVNGCSSPKSKVIPLQYTGITTVIDKTSILIYPNPASGFVQIEGNLNNTNVNIINIAGQIVISKYIQNSAKETLDISGLSQGLYFISINNNNGKTQVQKLIKEF